MFVRGVSLKTLGRNCGGLCLKQAQLAGTGDRFRAALNAQFGIRSAVVPFDSVQGEEEALANLTIRTPLSNELEDLQLSFAQWIINGL